MKDCKHDKLVYLGRNDYQCEVCGKYFRRDLDDDGVYHLLNLDDLEEVKV